MPKLKMRNALTSTATFAALALVLSACTYSDEEVAPAETANDALMQETINSSMGDF